jgi:hypothetical protein
VSASGGSLYSEGRHEHQVSASGGMVDTLALGASASGREGSSPFSRTKARRQPKGCLFTLVVTTDLNLHPRA